MLQARDIMTTEVITVSPETLVGDLAKTLAGKKIGGVPVVDANGVHYKEGQDFRIEGGLIRWIGNTPGMNLTNNKGLVCSIRYTYLPYWYVKTLIHEVRVARVDDYLGNRNIERMPFAAMLQREYVFELEDKDPKAPGQTEGTPNALRQMKAPGNAFFGSR